MQSLFTGFKDFITRGNVLELAVAVVVGTAFTALVNGIVEGLLNPLVALVAGRTDMTRVGAFTVNGTEFQPGLALDALLTFLLVAAAIYFFIMLPLNRLAAARAHDEATGAAAPPADVALLREIRDLLAAGSAPAATSSGSADGAGPAPAGGRPQEGRAGGAATRGPAGPPR